jgi:hypothetical protein
MQPSVTRPSPAPERPQTVTIVAILAAIGGVGAVLAVLAGAFVVHGVDSLDATDAVIVTPALALAALYVALAHGAWSLKPWAWPLGLVAAMATILYVAAILGTQWAELMRDAPALAWMALFIAGLAVVGLVLWFRPEVREAFGPD